MMRRSFTIAAVLGAILLLWQGAVSGLHVPHYLVPPPADVAAAFRHDYPVILRQTAFTLSAAAAGLVFSTALAVAIAVVFSRSRRIERATLPLVLAFRAAPVPAIAPLAMLFLGRGIATSILVVAIVSFFPLLVNLQRGLRAADRTAAELFHVLGATPWQTLVRLRAPAALPFLFTGLRIAGATAILGAMLSEWITGSRGLGELILESGDMREIEVLWAAVLTSIALALAVFWATSAGERAVLRWKT